MRTRMRCCAPLESISASTRQRSMVRRRPECAILAPRRCEFILARACRPKGCDSCRSGVIARSARFETLRYTTSLFVPTRCARHEHPRHSNRSHMPTKLVQLITSRQILKPADHMRYFQMKNLADLSSVAATRSNSVKLFVCTKTVTEIFDV